MLFRSRSLAPILAAMLASACGGDSTAARAATDSRQSAASHGTPTFAAPSGTYRVVDVANGGAVSGHVTIDGAVPAPPAPPVTADSADCDMQPGDPSIVHRGGAVENVVVWLSDVRAGVALPAEKRYAITQTGCLLDPRVQAISLGGTVNVRSVDPVRHTTVLLRAGTTDTLAVVRLYDAGSVVPDEHVGKRAGLVELRCEQHPWTRGWIAVFDHPYFAVTGADGSFRITDVPPGKHTLMIWHERGGAPQSQTVDVPASGEAKVEAKVALH